MSRSDGFHLIFMDLIADWERLIKTRNKYKNRPSFFIVFLSLRVFPKDAIIMSFGLWVMLRKNVKSLKIKFNSVAICSICKKTTLSPPNCEIRSPGNGVVNMLFSAECFLSKKFEPWIKKTWKGHFLWVVKTH